MLIVLATGLVTGLIVLPLLLHVVYGYRGSDLLLLAALFMPALWLNRLHQYTFSVGAADFFLFWGVLGAVGLTLIAFANQRTRALTSRTAIRLGRVWLAMIVVLSISNLANGTANQDLLRGVQAVCYLVFPPFAAWAIVTACSFDERHIDRAVVSLLWLGILVGAVSISTSLAPGLFRAIVTTYKTSLASGRAFTPLGGPSATAMCLIPVACVAGAALLARTHVFLALASSSFCFLGVLVSQARAAALAFIVVMLYLYGVGPRGVGRRIALAFTMIVLVFVPLAFAVSRVHSLERFTQGIENTEADTSIAVRASSMKAAFVYGVRHPWFGGGWGLVYPAARTGDDLAPVEMMMLDGMETAHKPHSLFGLVFAEGGVVALLLVIWACLLVWRGLRTLSGPRDDSGYELVHGFRAGFLAIVAMSVVQDHLFVLHQLPFFTYLFVWVGLALSGYYRVMRRAVPGIDHQDNTPAMSRSGYARLVG